jgi:hypothetical protein
MAFWAVLAAAVWRGALTPAALRNARISRVSGGAPAYACLSWGYGAGARPLSIIFDLTLADGATGSITTDGEASEAELPFRSAAPGPYTLAITATYRLLGVVRRTTSRLSGELGAPAA